MKEPVKHYNGVRDVLNSHRVRVGTMANAFSLWEKACLYHVPARLTTFIGWNDDVGDDATLLK